MCVDLREKSLVIFLMKIDLMIFLLITLLITRVINVCLCLMHEIHLSPIYCRTTAISTLQIIIAEGL